MVKRTTKKVEKKVERRGRRDEVPEASEM